MGIKTAPEVLLKTPIEIVIKDVEFGGSDMASGEVLATIVAVTISPTGAGHLNKDAQVISGTKVQLTLSQGVSGTTYTIDVKVTTSFLQTLQACCKMRVADC